MKIVNARTIYLIIPFLKILPNNGYIGSKNDPSREFLSDSVENPREDESIAPISMRLYICIETIARAGTIYETKLILGKEGDTHRSAPNAIVVNTSELMRNQNHPWHVRRMQIERVTEQQGGRGRISH
ncbi:hypothetical protein V6Z11_D10G113400 [Gossypium hirsutum]